MHNLKLGEALSPLEQDVMRVLWKKNSARVREIQANLKRKRDVTQSSVAVILDRLHAKGVVARKMERARGGIRYIYTAKDKVSFEQGYIDSIVNQLVGRFGDTAIAYFHKRFKR